MVVIKAQEEVRGLVLLEEYPRHSEAAFGDRVYDSWMYIDIVPHAIYNNTIKMSELCRLWFLVNVLRIVRMAQL